MTTNQLLVSLAVVTGFAAPASAATYAVKAAGGGDFTTISACASSAGAGDICEVYAGSYSGWTQSKSGSAGSPITFLAHAGDTVTVTSSITVTNRAYITVDGFHFTSSGVRGLDGSITTNHIVVRNNVIASTSSGNVVGIYLYGDSNLIDHNNLSNTDGDCMDLGGANVVVRNNNCHDVTGATSGQHIDFIQVQGDGTTPTLSYSLIENNVEQNCTNDGGNCHFVIVRTCSGVSGCSLVADTIIVRYNFLQNLNGSGMTMGSLNDNVPNARVYNNTVATEAKSGENGDCGSFEYAANGTALNNICYNTVNGPWAPFLWYTAAPNGVGNGNLTYTTGFSGSWNTPYSSESTYAALRNQNPLFANYPNDGSLQSGSPARNAGVALTTVAAADSGSGTVLKVNDAHGLQPGWAGTNPDTIRVGGSAIAQIASIDYSTNTITLAGAVTRSPGDPVYLYANSSRNVVLFGSRPDVGAFPYGGALIPSPPSNVRIIR